MTTTFVDTAVSLRAFPALDGLAANECAALASFMRERSVSRGQLLETAGETPATLHFVTQGRVKVTRTMEDGRELPLEILDAPVVVGEYARDANEPTTVTLTALTDVQALSITSSDLATAARLHPGIALSVVESLTARARGLAERVESLTMHDASHRVVRVILNMATAAYESQGVPMVAGVTHQDLAMLAGTSRETATRTISALVRRGIVAQKGRRLVIDLLRLHEVASG
jgi:CRP-like cAMP-binding protein